MDMTATAPAEKQVSATLIAPREEAIKFLNTLLERGEELKAMRIRNGDELDEARGKKLEWMQDTTDWLNNLFDNSSVADYVNDWVGKIFPEYADFGNFVEQFYEEVDFRLGKLRAVLMRVEQTAESPSPVAPSLTQPRATQPSAHSAPVSSAVPGHMESTMPAATSVGSRVLFVTHGAKDASADAVLQLMQQLSVAVVEADHTNGLIETLESRTDTGFIIVHTGDGQATLSHHSMFKLGYCAGRIGMQRMCMMHGPTTQITGDAHGIPHTSIDAGGGWQLHLARQLKRAGLNVDLNRLC